MAKCADCGRPISDGVRCSSCFSKLLKETRQTIEARKELDQKEKEKDKER
jgi:DNA-directed RNA polymerase subunit RPC12/RpoP